MKNFLILLVLSCGLIIPLFPVKALDLGLDMAGNAAINAGYEEATETTLAEKIGLAVQTAMSFLGIIFTVLMVYAGFTWMLARGDEGKVDTAKKVMTAAIIGLVIVVASYSISYYITRKFFFL